MSKSLDLYERDFVRWSEEQAHALKAAAASGTNLPLDWEHLAEEIDGLGKSLRSELRNRLATVIEHLLELSLSAADGPRPGWIGTIRRERLEIEELLDENPSLRSSLTESLDSAYRKARKLVEVSLGEHGEWSSDYERKLARMRFVEAEVFGPWLPPDGSREGGGSSHGRPQS